MWCNFSERHSEESRVCQAKGGYYYCIFGFRFKCWILRDGSISLKFFFFHFFPQGTLLKKISSSKMIKRFMVEGIILWRLFFPCFSKNPLNFNGGSREISERKSLRRGRYYFLIRHHFLRFSNFGRLPMSFPPGRLLISLPF